MRIAFSFLIDCVFCLVRATRRSVADAATPPSIGLQRGRKKHRRHCRRRAVCSSNVHGKTHTHTHLCVWNNLEGARASGWLVGQKGLVPLPSFIAGGSEKGGEEADTWCATKRERAAGAPCSTQGGARPTREARLMRTKHSRPLVVLSLVERRLAASLLFTCPGPP